jgi:hypothetical protein
MVCFGIALDVRHSPFSSQYSAKLVDFLWESDFAMLQSEALPLRLLGPEEYMRLHLRRLQIVLLYLSISKSSRDTSYKLNYTQPTQHYQHNFVLHY